MVSDSLQASKGSSYITRTFKGENVGRFGIQNLLTLGGEGWSAKENLLTVVDGSRRGRVLSKNVKILQIKNAVV